MTYLCNIKFFELFFVKKVILQSDILTTTRKIQNQRLGKLIKKQMCITV